MNNSVLNRIVSRYSNYAGNVYDINLLDYLNDKSLRGPVVCCIVLSFIVCADTNTNNITTQLTTITHLKPTVPYIILCTKVRK